MFGAQPVIRSEAVHNRVHGHVCKPKGSGGENVGDAGVSIRVVTFVRGHEDQVSTAAQDMWQVVIPCQDLPKHDSASQMHE